MLGWRLERQLLDPIGNLDVRETVRALACIQAQVQSSAELAIALRRAPSPAGGRKLRFGGADRLRSVTSLTKF